MDKGNRIIVLLSILTGFCITTTAYAELVITEVMSKSGHFECHSDWWELTNTGPSSVDLTGYSWDDSDQVAGTHVFGSFTIDAGESAMIVDSFDSDYADYWKSFWGLGPEVTVYALIGDFGAEHLGDADGVFLYDASDAIATSVAWSSSTWGLSHEWDASGTSLGLSVNGENGAYASFDDNPDVASPGYAVPEPCTLLLFSLGSLALRRGFKM